LLEVRNLDKDYSLGKTTIAALRGVNLSIDHGEFVSIMGPSGCGKTTLLNILGCIDRPTRGQVLLGASMWPASATTRRRTSASVR
jgi:putative ABC transport system ATP-binding protein